VGWSRFDNSRQLRLVLGRKGLSNRGGFDLYRFLGLRSHEPIRMVNIDLVPELKFHSGAITGSSSALRN